MNNVEGLLPEIGDLVVAAKPVDLSAAAVAGRWFNMANCDSVNALLISALGTAGDDPVITLEQAKDSSGTGAKALNLYRVDYKIGATAFTSATDKWQRVTTINRDNPAASYTHTDGAENEFTVNVFIKDSDLDVNNGFRYIRIKVADVGANAQLGALLYIPIARKYTGAQNTSFLA